MTDASIHPARALRARDAHAPAVVRVAVVASALAGSLALALVARSVSAQGAPASLGYALFVALAGVGYVWRPHLAAAALAGLGALGCVGVGFALVTGGTVPWMLVAFWGSSAALLAGLLDYIGRGGPDRLSSVTVSAIASLLVLSAVGLGEYVRMNWSYAERAMLESVQLTREPRSGPRLLMAPTRLEQVPGGKWAAHWTVRTGDPAEAWDGVHNAVESDGWTIFAEEDGYELRARKDAFELMVTAEEPVGPLTGPGSYTTAPSSAGWYVEMAAYVSGDSIGQQ